eukprot:7050163-Alexandrium_andersonii.AAC.1
MADERNRPCAVEAEAEAHVEDSAIDFDFTSFGRESCADDPAPDAQRAPRCVLARPSAGPTLLNTDPAPC